MTTKFTSDRIKQVLNGHLFGHYDSRGGSTLVIGNILEAIRTYAEIFIYEDDAEHKEQMTVLAVEERMFSGPVIFCDEEHGDGPGGGEELLADYDGNFKCGVLLLQQWDIDQAKEQMAKFEDPNDTGEIPDEDAIFALVFWTGDEKPTIFYQDEWQPNPQEGFILPIDPGEDACGCILMQAGESY